MEGVAAILLAGFYCFSYLKIPEEVFGQSFPIQFLIALASVPTVILSILITRKVWRLSEISKSFLTSTLFFLVYLVADLSYRWIESQGSFFDEYYDLQLFGIDLLKYIACFSATFTIYFALSRNQKLSRVIFLSLMFSGTASIFITYIFLILFYAKITVESSFLAPTFESFIGIWPANGLSELPRIAGTAFEPQQFSSIFLTPILIMLSRKNIKRWWFVALAGIVLLFLSQSKFSLASLFAVLIYALIVHKPYRPWIASLASLVVPSAIYFLSRQPVFADTLEYGTENNAIATRISNFNVLLYEIATNFWHGVGPGQFATFMNYELGFQWSVKNYIPNLDYLKVFAETGIIGFLVIIILFYRLMARYIAGYKYCADEQQDQYIALLIGTTVLLLSMFFTYQLLQNQFWVNAGILMYLFSQQEDKLRKRPQQSDELPESGILSET